MSARMGEVPRASDCRRNLVEQLPLLWHCNHDRHSGHVTARPCETCDYSLFNRIANASEDDRYALCRLHGRERRQRPGRYNHIDT